MAAPLSGADRAIPLVSGESQDKQKIRALQDAVLAVAQAQGLPEGLLCARKHLEALLDGRGWPDALAGWRRELLEPALTPLLPRSSAGG